MTWRIDFKETALKDLKKIDRTWQKKIIHYLEDRVGCLPDPRESGKPLGNNLNGLWRYRVGDYRIICQLDDEKITVLVLAIKHRKHAYKKTTSLFSDRY